MSCGRLLRLLLGVVAAATVAAALALQLPQSPVRSVVVAGPSMKPTLEGSDLVFTVRRPRYGPGDVVAFRVPHGQPAAGKLVIHRIVGGDGEGGFLLRGDNREGVDPWRPRHEDVVGEAVAVVPRLGLVPAATHTPLGLALLAALVTAGVLGFGPRAPQPID